MTHAKFKSARAGTSQMRSYLGDGRQLPDWLLGYPDGQLLAVNLFVSVCELNPLEACPFSQAQNVLLSHLSHSA